MINKSHLFLRKRNLQFYPIYQTFAVKRINIRHNFFLNYQSILIVMTQNLEKLFFRKIFLINRPGGKILLNHKESQKARKCDRQYSDLIQDFFNPGVL